jgi:TATA-box binding protein (TBP) (component of TFIID and TFIIIB)
VIVGVGDESRVLLAVHALVWALRRWMKLDTGLYNFVVDNVVGDFKLPYELNIDLFLADHELEAQWSPDIFKGLSYKPYKKPPVFVLFKSGKCIITGGKTALAIREAYEDKIELFNKYRLGHEYRQMSEEEKTEREWMTQTDSKPKKKRRLQ